MKLDFIVHILHKHVYEYLYWTYSHHFFLVFIFIFLFFSSFTFYWSIPHSLYKLLIFSARKMAFASLLCYHSKHADFFSANVSSFAVRYAIFEGMKMISTWNIWGRFCMYHPAVIAGRGVYDIDKLLWFPGWLPCWRTWCSCGPSSTLHCLLPQALYRSYSVCLHLHTG